VLLETWDGILRSLSDRPLLSLSLIRFCFVIRALEIQSHRGDALALGWLSKTIPTLENILALPLSSTSPTFHPMFVNGVGSQLRAIFVYEPFLLTITAPLPHGCKLFRTLNRFRAN